jgi:hypothetical protein
MEEELIGLLLGDAGVSGIVATRVWPGSMPQGSRRPAVVVNTIGATPEYVDEGEAGLVEARVQIDSWDNTYSGAKLLSRAVKAALSAYQTDGSPMLFQTIMVDTERDDRHSGSNQNEYLYRTSVDFIVWHQT